MPRIPYERIAPEANKLYEKAVQAKDFETYKFWYDAYVSFLKAAGWDPLSFDQETLKKVDEGWGEEDEKVEPVIWN